MQIISDFRKTKRGKIIIWGIEGLLFICIVCAICSVFFRLNDTAQDSASSPTEIAETSRPTETTQPQFTTTPVPTNTSMPTNTPTTIPTSTPTPIPTATQDRTRENIYGELGKPISIDGLLVTVKEVKVFGPPPESGHLDGITYVLVEIVNESNPEAVRINSGSFEGIDAELGENSGEWDYTVEEKLGITGFRRKESATLEVGDSVSGWIGIRGVNLEEFIFNRNILPPGRKGSEYYDILHIPIPMTD